MAALPPGSTHDTTTPAATAAPAKAGLPSYPNRNAAAGAKMAPKTAARPAKRRRSSSAWLTFSALVLTMLWFGTVGFYVIKAGGFTSFLESSGAAAIVAVTGLMLAPTALFWMIFAYIKRAYDIESAIEPLMRQLSLVTGQSGIAEGRIRRFNDALSEQVSLLKETSVVSSQSAEQALGLLERERAELEESQTTFSTRITALVETMRGQTGALDQLLQSGQQHLVTAAARTGELTEALAGETTQAEARMAEIVTAISNTLDEVERVTGDRLNDIDATIAGLADREKSLRTEAAVVTADVEESANAMVEATERFKELAASGRVEADKILATLNEQTRTIDNRTEQVRGRISETQSMMSRMADELTVAALTLSNMGEQVGDGISLRVAALNDAGVALDATAAKISESLDKQLGNYGEQQSFVSTLYNELLFNLTKQSNELIKSAETLTARATETTEKVGTAVGELTRTTGESLDRYETVAEKAEAQATSVASNFNSSIEQYAVTARQLNTAAAELQMLATRCEEAITTMDTTISERAGMLDQVSNRMSNTSMAIKDDASGLVLTLQQLTDRLETVRAAATATSDQTVMRLTDIANTAGRNLTGIEALASTTIQKLSDMGSEVGRQQLLIAEQVDGIQAVLAGVSDNLASRVSSILTQVERSSSNASELVEGFLHKAQQLGPDLEAQATYATNLAAHAASAMGDQAQLFGERLGDEKGRWQAMVEDQAKAFADTYRELQQQMAALRDVQNELNKTTQEANGRLMLHNTNIVDLESRLAHSTQVQTGQLSTLREEIEKIIDHLQSQATAISTVSQTALNDVRNATEVFGSEARSLGELSRETEGSIIVAAARMTETKTLMSNTREDVADLRRDVESVLARLAAQTSQMTEMRDVSNDSAITLTASVTESVAQLDTLTGRLARAVEQAALARTSAYENLDQVDTRITAGLNAMEQQANLTVEKISASADQISSASRLISEQMVRTADQISATDATLGQLSTHATNMRRQLIDESEAMVVALDRITQQLTSSMGVLRTSGESTLDAARTESDELQMMVANCLSALSSSSSQLHDVSQTAGVYLNSFGAQLTSQIDLVRQASGELSTLVDVSTGSEAQLTDTLGNLMLQVTRARGDLSALDLQIADQTTRLTEQQTRALSGLSQTLTTLEQISNRIVGSSQDALTTVAKVQERYSDIATYADDVVGTRAAALLRAVADGETAMSHYAEAAAANTNTVTGQQEQLESMLSSLRRESAASEERLASLADKITAAGVATGTSAQAILQRLGTVAETLIREFSDVTNIAEASTDTLRGQSDALRYEVGQLSAAAQNASSVTGTALTEMVGKSADVKQVFAQDMEAMLSSLAQAQSRYEQMAADMARQQQEANQTITSIATNFSILLQTTQSTMEQLRGELDTTATAASATLTQSGDTLSTQTEGFANLGERLATVVEQIGFQTGQVLGDLRGVTERLEAVQTRTGNMAEETEARLTSAAVALESRQQSLGQTAEQAAAQLQQASETVTAQTATLGNQAQVAEAQVHAISHAVTSLQHQAATLREQMAGETDLMGRTLARAVAELENTSNSLAKHGHQAQTVIASLGDTMEGSVTQIAAATAEYSRGQEELNAAAQTVLSETARILGDFYDFKSQLTTQVGELGSHMETLAGSADERVRHLAGSLSGIVSEMAATEQALTGSMTALVDQHGTLRTEVDQSMRTIGAATGQLRQTTSDSYSDIEKLGESMSQFGANTRATVTAEIMELRELVESATALISDLGRQLETQVTAVTDAGTALAHVSGSVNDNTAAALSRLQTLNQRLEAAKLAASTVTEQAAKRVADILAQVDRDDDDMQQAG